MFEYNILLSCFCFVCKIYYNIFNLFCFIYLHEIFNVIRIGRRVLIDLMNLLLLAFVV